MGKFCSFCVAPSLFASPTGTFARISSYAELISDAEGDGVSFCTPASGDPRCNRRMSDGFISAAQVSRAEDGKWVQVSYLVAAFESST